MTEKCVNAKGIVKVQLQGDFRMRPRVVLGAPVALVPT
jgi:hypothetical protein